MYSIEEFDSDKLGKIVNDFLMSTDRKNILINKSYWLQENYFISQVKKMIWSDKQKSMIENQYVANNKIGYGFGYDIISQKVTTLFDENPQIVTDYKLDDELVKLLGYNVKQLASIVSYAGYGYMYVSDIVQTPFETENIIDFYDDDGELKEFIRIVDIRVNKNGIKTVIFEHYSEDGLTKHKLVGDTLTTIKELTPYSFTIRKDIVGSQTITKQLSKLPIVRFDNNKQLRTDLTPAIINKINAIDLVQSDFVNNLSDFADVFWSIKNGNSNVDNEVFDDFLESVKRTKKVVTSGDGTSQIGVDAITIPIPHEARRVIAEILKADLVNDSGYVDYKTIIGGGNITNLAIKAASLPLMQRVSDFEWQAYKFMLNVVTLLQEYWGVKFDFDIEFRKLTISNITETIDNALKVKGTIPEDDYLKQMVLANMIDNIDEAKIKLAEESTSKISLAEGDYGMQQMQE